MFSKKSKVPDAWKFLYRICCNLQSKSPSIGLRLHHFCKLDIFDTVNVVLFLHTSVSVIFSLFIISVAMIIWFFKKW